MKHSISALTLGASILALGSMACEARDCDSTEKVEVEEGADSSEEGACVELVSLANFEGDLVEDSLEYQTDANITVQGNNGNITIHDTQGMDEIGVSMLPVVARAHDICDGEELEDNGYCAAVNNDLSKFQPILEQDDDGNWLIQALLDGGRATLKAEIDVWLPTGFNGELIVVQGNGGTEVQGVYDARSIIVDSDNGSCDLDVGAASKIDIYCDNGSTDVTVRGIPTGTQKRHIENGLGDLTVSFPDTDEPYTVQALSGGEPITVNAPNNCEEEQAAASSLSVFCNDATSDDPVYVVESESSLVDITLNL